MTVVLYNARIFDGKRMTGASALELENGMITALSNKTVGDIDLNGRLIAPGLIDTHTHGYGSFDAMGGTGAIASLAGIYAENGTTAFYPTSFSADSADLRAFVSSVKAARVQQSANKEQGANRAQSANRTGAKVLGAHLEGPFLAPSKRGAHGEGFLTVPTLKNYDDITGGDMETVARVTLAPELDEGLRLTRKLLSRGVHVSVGHTAANGEEAVRALEAGVRTCAHFFNAMPPLHHRDRNITSVGLSDTRVFIEFIPDLLHISADAVKIIMCCKGGDKFIIRYPARACRTGSKRDIAKLISRRNTCPRIPCASYRLQISM
jgi:N-acetylglucosamine-6-phosphate deacetylase